MILNPEQLDAVTSVDDTLVVAGAGSGKTTVLAMRVLYAILHKRIPISQILVLTFTHKATKEMYQRIYELLDQVCREKRFLGQDFSGDSELCRFVENERDGFTAAQISTIDSFVLKIARIIAPRLGYLFPLSVSNENEDKLRTRYIYDFLRKTDEEVINKVVRVVSISGLIDGLLTPLLQDYSVPLRDFATMKTQLFKILEQRAAATMQKANELIVQLDEQCIQVFGVTPAQALAQSEDANENQIDVQLQVLEQEYGITNKAAQLFVHIYNTYVNYNNNPHWWRAHSGELHFDQRGLAVTKFFKNHAGSWDAFKVCFATLRDVFSELLDIYYTLDNGDFYGQFYSLCQRCVGGWEAQKKRSGKLSFYELSRMVNHGLLEFTDISKKLVSLYRELVVDEFQDVNDPQKELFFILKTAAKNSNFELKLFFVGDPKQAIYSFRGADIARYLALSKNFSTIKELKTNYRSQASVILSNNSLFSRAFADAAINADVDDIAYSSQSSPSLDISSAQHTKKTQAIQCDILTYERGQDKGMMEVIHCANRIQQLHEQEGIDYSRMAVLSRTNTILYTLQRVFRTEGIPFHLEEETLHFKQDPISDFYSWLSLLVNPSNSLAYAEVLRSALSTLSDDTVMQALTYHSYKMGLSDLSFSEDDEVLFFLRDEEFDLYCTRELGLDLEQLYSEHQYDITRLTQLRTRYHEARYILKEQGLYECLQHFWYGCGYVYAITYHAKVDKSSVFEDHYHVLSASIHHSKNVYQCIELLDNLMRGNANASSLQMALNVKKEGVQVMTTHKAKGLEFDLVFLLELGRTLRVQHSDRRVFEIEDVLAIDLGIMGEKNKSHSPIARYNKTQKNKQLSEELRILYVGMTRAKERTILISTVDSKYQSEDGYQKYAEARSSPLSWLLAQEEGFVREELNEGQGQNKVWSEATGAAYQIFKGEENMESLNELSARSLSENEALPRRGELHKEQALSIAAHKKKTHKIISELADTLANTGSLIGSPVGPAVGPAVGPLWLSPSSLDHFSDAGKGTVESSRDYIPFSDDALESILGKHHLYSDFGSYCHYQLSALSVYGTRFSEPVSIASKLVNLTERERVLFFSEAHALCDGFIGSSFWHKCKGMDKGMDSNAADAVNTADASKAVYASPTIMTDYEYLHHTSVEPQGAQEPQEAQLESETPQGVYLKGFIDLLVSAEDCVYIIDFKTDSHIAPEKYFLQLAAYRAAIESMPEYKQKKIYCVLYYLRNGEVVHLPPTVQFESCLAELLHEGEDKREG